MSNRRTCDMTVGNPMRLILTFAVPMLIGNIFQQIYSVVDTMIAGYNLGDGAIAAIGVTSTVYSLLIGFASGVNSGFGIQVSRAYGAGDSEELRRTVATMFWLNLTITAVPTVISLVGIRPLMRLIQVPETIFEQSCLYISILLGGMVTTIGYNMCAGFLRSVGNSRTPLLFLVFSCALNMGFDTLFIVVLHTGVGGAAAATVLAQGCSVLFCGGYIWRHYHDLLPEKRHLRMEKPRVMDMLSTGLSMGLMQSVFAIGSVILQGAINSLGETIITAHTAARRIVDILMQPMGTISAANATFVSQNRGAERYDRIQTTLRRVFLLELAWSLVAIVAAYTFGRIAIRLLIGTSDDVILSNAVLNLRIMISFFPPLGILLALRTAMQSLGCKIAPVLSSGIELGMKAASAFWIVPRYGYVGASCTEPMTWVVCMTFLLLVYAFRRKELYTPQKYRRYS